MERIASRANPAVRRFRDAAGQGGSSSGVMLLDGDHLVREALRSRVALELVAVTDSAFSAHGTLVQDAERSGARALHVSQSVMAAMSPVRQPAGIVALARITAAPIERCLEGTPQLVMVVAGVQDAGNVGAIVRTAEACGVTGVICTSGTADPFGWKALRGGMGSQLRVPIAVRADLTRVAAECRRRDIALAATVPHDGVPLDRVDLRRPTAMLLGPEGEGLSADDLAQVDGRIMIPMQPPVESLNVAIAAAIIAYEAARQRRLA